MKRSISVVRPGYVGLPVAVAFGRTARVVGFDLSPGNHSAGRLTVYRYKSICILDMLMEVHRCAQLWSLMKN